MASSFGRYNYSSGRDNNYGGGSSYNNYSGGNYGGYNSGGNGGNSYNNNRDQPTLGSFRVNYHESQDIHKLAYMSQKWREYPPGSIVCRAETLHISTTELRIQDYYLMRKGELKYPFESKLKDALRRDSFNEQILKIRADRLPPVSQQRSIDLDSLKGRIGNGGYGAYNGGGNRENVFGNSSSGMNFNRDNNYNNNYRDNVFNRNSNSSYGNGGNGGNYRSNSYNNNSSYNNNNGGYNNGGYNNNSYNGGNNGGASIFNRNSNNGGYNNIFSGSNNNNNNNGNYNNNNNSGGNIFNRGSNNNNSGNNNAGSLFNRGNNNNNNNNIFSNNNNNNSGGNIFNRNGNNNNNNILNNGGNNLFNHGNNNSNNNQINTEVVYAMRSMMDENRMFMQKMTKQFQLDQNNDHYKYNIQEKSPFDRIMEDPTLPPIDKFMETSIKPKDQTIIILKPQYADLNHSIVSGGSRISNNSYIGTKNGNSRLMANDSRFIPVKEGGGSIRPTESRLTNQPKNSSQLINNHTASRNLSLRMSNSQHNFLQHQFNCNCEVRFVVEWKDDDFKYMDKLELRATLHMTNLKTSQPNWQKELVLKLKELHPIVRVDAIVEIQDVKEVNRQNSTFTIRGTLIQQIVNLPEQYTIKFSKITNNLIHHLSITNRDFGQVSWLNQTIDVVHLDLQDNRNTPEPFQLSQNMIVCESEELNKPCVVRFKQLPTQTNAQFSVDPELAKVRFGEYIALKSDGKFRLTDIWKGGWEMEVSQFPDVGISE